MNLFYAPAVLDIEASGFGKGSYPIEIGVCGDDGSTFSWLVLPEKDWTHWEDEAFQLHGITRERLFDEGSKASFIAEQLNELFEGQVLYSDGWGVDSAWLSLLYYSARKSMLFKLDTLPRVLSEFQLTQWESTKAAMRLKHQLTHHRAAEDAKLVQLTFVETYKEENLLSNRDVQPVIF